MASIEFSEFDLPSAQLAALEALGFHTPSPIQVAAIAPQRAGRDILAMAATGSGKTAAFALPLLAALAETTVPAGRRRTQALVLVPTRELAQQIAASLVALGGAARPRVCLATGGLPRRVQVARLVRGTEVVVATPGRLGDLMAAGAVRLDRAAHLVIDEADRMLDLGFLDVVLEIAAAMPAERRTALFSATMPPGLVLLAQRLLREPVLIDVVRGAVSAPIIRERVELVARAGRLGHLMRMLDAPDAHRVIVFCRTRRGSEALAAALGRRGRAVELIHGERRQSERQAALLRFRRGEARVLVATDVVARGIDVPGVTHVINCEVPDDPETYVHRIGRTGRNGASGEAVTFCAPHEVRRLREIERATGRRLLPGGAPGDVRAAFPGRRAAGNPPAMLPVGGLPAVGDAGLADAGPSSIACGDTCTGSPRPGGADSGDMGAASTGLRHIVLGETVRGETVRGETNPGKTDPGKTSPGKTGPGETGPEETGPGESGPDRGPADTGPAQTGERS